jgi:hypothetical protein
LEEEAQAFSSVGQEMAPPKTKSQLAPASVPQDELSKPPKMGKPVQQLAWDLEALIRMFNDDIPSEVLLQASRVYSILYGFANASGTGFGSTVLGADGIEYRIGTWESDVDKDSSNF